MQDITHKLLTLGLELPAPNPAAGNYKPYMAHAGLLSVSGQTCKKNGHIVYQGKVGQELSLEQGAQAARLCALNLIVQLRDACQGDWDNFLRCLKLTVFVNCTADFDQMPRIADGASDLLLELFGERGHHTRSAVGACSLPGGSAVEIDGLFAILPTAKP
jgi:enamine deaminase RidA (YjgF/YER057c/UK114 family)